LELRLRLRLEPGDYCNETKDWMRAFFSTKMQLGCYAVNLPKLVTKANIKL
jgi:hypothetical protein